MPLHKLAEEVRIPESEAVRIAIYFGLGRGTGGCYDDREIVKTYIKYLHKRLYGCVDAKNAKTVPAPTLPENPNCGRRSAVRRKRGFKTPWSGSLFLQ